MWISILVRQHLNIETAPRSFLNLKIVRIHQHAKSKVVSSMGSKDIAANLVGGWTVILSFSQVVSELHNAQSDYKLTDGEMDGEMDGHPTQHKAEALKNTTITDIHSTSQEICTWFVFCCDIAMVNYPYPSGLYHWHWGNHTHMIAPVSTRTTRTLVFWDTHRRPRITHISDSHQIPSPKKKDKVKVTNLKNFKFLIWWILLKMQSGHDSVQTDRGPDGQGETSIPPSTSLNWGV